MNKILELLKTKGVLVVAFLVCLNLFTCTRSCTSSRVAKRAQKELVVKQQASDSIIALRDDSIKALNKKIEVLEAEAKGLEKTLQVQGDAISKISEAKKNINVVVKQKK